MLTQPRMHANRDRECTLLRRAFGAAGANRHEEKSHAKQTSSVVPQPHNYGGQVAPSAPLATSTKDPKARRKEKIQNSRKRAQRGKAATKSWWNAVGLDKSGV